MIMLSFNVSGWNEGDWQTFATGSTRNFYAPVAGVYLFELCGAQGGSVTGASGGKGACVKGNITLEENVRVRVRVGERPEYICTQYNCDGGWNGGGSSYASEDHSNTWAAGGGGMTDIRIGGSGFEYRALVAAGGGGAVRFYSSGETHNGGYGGCDEGGDGTSQADDYGQGADDSSPGCKYPYNFGHETCGGMGSGGNAEDSNTQQLASGGGGSGLLGGGGSGSRGSGGGGISLYKSYFISSTWGWTFDSIAFKYRPEDTVCTADSNTGDGTAKVTLIEKFSEPGSVSFSPTSEGWTSSNIQVSFSASDATSYKRCSTTGSTCTPTVSGSSITLSSSGEYTVCARGVNEWYEGSISCSSVGAYKVDKTNPTISINPEEQNWTNENITVNINGADTHSGIDYVEYCYTDNGTTCTPNTSGDLITLTEPGEYTVCAKAVDNVGHESDIVCSETDAYKIDRTQPGNTIPTPSHKPWTNESIEVVFWAEDGVSGIDTFKYCVTTNGSSCSPSITADGFELTESGEYTACYQSIDNAGNLGNVSCTNPNAYKLDKTPPSSTTHVWGYRVWVNTDFTEHFTATDDYSGIDYFLHCVTTGSSCDPDNISPASTSFSGHGMHTFTENGEYTLCTRAVDNVGNEGAINCSDQGAYQIDQEPPSAPSFIPENQDWTNENIFVEFNATDEVSGISQCFHCVNDEGGTCTPTPPITDHNVTLTNTGEFTICAYCRDFAGNNGPTNCSSIDAYKIDKEDPSTSGERTSGVLGENDWYVTNVQYTLSTNDGHSGINTTYYCIDSSNSCTPNQEYSSPLTLDNNGYNYVRFYSEDNVGNEEMVQSSGLIKIDKENPTITNHIPESQDWTNQNINVEFNATDNYSGISHYQYCFRTDGDTCTPNIEGSSITFSSTNEYTLCSRAVDNAGNVGSTHCSDIDAYKIDKESPSITNHIPESQDWTDLDIVIEFDATDEYSGINYYLYCYSNESSTCTPSISGMNLTLTETGEYTVCSRAIDNMGHEGPVHCSEIDAYKIDKDGPIVSFDPESQDWISSNIEININTISHTSPVDTVLYCYTDDGTTCTPNTDGDLITLTETGEYTVCANANNTNGFLGTTECSSINAYKIDKEDPTITNHIPESQDWTNQNIHIEFNATDNYSGISHYQYCTRTDGNTCTPNIEGSSITFSSTNEYTLCTRAVDNAGNVGSTHCSDIDAYKIDKVSPVTTDDYDFHDEWIVTSSVDIDLTVESYGPSGLDTTYYCIDSSNTCTPNQEYTGAITIDTLGTNYLRYRSVANSGETEDTNVVNVFLDESAPGYVYLDPESADWQSTNILVNFEYADGISPIDEYTYCYTDDGSTCTPDTNGSSILFTEPGQYTICVFGTTMIGGITLTECSAANAYKLDKQIPSNVVIDPIERDWDTIDITIEFGGSSDPYSGIDTYLYCYRDDASPCTPDTEGTELILSSSGQYTVCARSRDNAGNLGNTICSADHAYKIDKLPPSAVTLDPIEQELTQEFITVNFSATDDYSGIKRYKYCYSNESLTCTPDTIGDSVTLTETGEYTVCARAVNNVDLEGPVTCSEEDAYKIWREGPLISKTFPPDGWTGYTDGVMNFKFELYDALLGSYNLTCVNEDNQVEFFVEETGLTPPSYTVEVSHIFTTSGMKYCTLAASSNPTSYLEFEFEVIPGQAIMVSGYDYFTYDPVEIEVYVDGFSVTDLGYNHEIIVGCDYHEVLITSPYKVNEPLIIVEGCPFADIHEPLWESEIIVNGFNSITLDPLSPLVLHTIINGQSYYNYDIIETDTISFVLSASDMSCEGDWQT